MRCSSKGELGIRPRRRRLGWKPQHPEPGLPIHAPRVHSPWHVSHLPPTRSLRWYPSVFWSLSSQCRLRISVCPAPGCPAPCLHRICTRVSCFPELQAPSIPSRWPRWPRWRRPLENRDLTLPYARVFGLKPRCPSSAHLFRLWSPPRILVPPPTPEPSMPFAVEVGGPPAPAA